MYKYRAVLEVSVVIEASSEEDAEQKLAVIKKRLRKEGIRTRKHINLYRLIDLFA